jgi:hypothetical protein
MRPRLLAAVAALSAVLLTGCATLAGPEPLTREQIVAMSKAGEPPQAIIEKLRETYTVLPLSGSEIVRLHDEGVAPEVLDYLQLAQISEVRRREALFSSMYGCSWGSRLYPRFQSRFGPYPPWGMGPWGPC